jgi:hypothetical protein
MPPRSSTPVDAAPSATTIASLPHALLARVFARLPVDARLRASEVCRGWRHVLATERSLWTALDLSRSSGVACRVTNALLRTAAAKAGGALTALDVHGRNGIRYDTLLAVVTANAGALEELRTDRASFRGEVGSEAVEALLRAAPRLRAFVTDLYCDAEEAPHVLANDGVFTPLRITRLLVSNGHWEEESDDEAVRAFAASLAAYATPLKYLSFQQTLVDAADALDAVLDGALANRVQSLCLEMCNMSLASVPSLVRLLNGGALTSLSMMHFYEQLLDAPAAALLGGALRTHTTIKHVTLCDVDLWRDAGAAITLLNALVAHPSLRGLQLQFNRVDAAHAACIGAALFALVAANAPALSQLDISVCNLGDAGLRPLFDALPRNTHLRALECQRNDMSEAFARDVLLPAVHANTSLNWLTTMVGAHEWDSTRKAEDIVRQRRVAP